MFFKSYRYNNNIGNQMGLLFLLFLLVSACTRDAPSGIQKGAYKDYNFILITIDTLRADHVSGYGYKRQTTPNLDKFAKRGTLFKNCYAQGSWTVPSMVSLFTSLSPLTHGINHGVAKVPDEPNTENIDNEGKLDVFYQEVLDDSHNTLTEVMEQNGFITAGFTTNGHLINKQGFSQGFQFYDEESCLWGRADCVNEQVFPWLEKNASDKFFLWVHYFDPHIDYGLPDRRYDPPGEYSKLFSHDGKLWGKDQSLALYDGEIRFTDDQVGKLLGKLRSLNLDEKTIVIITADHGEEFLDHGKWGHSKTVYNELIRVPLLVYIPGTDSMPEIVDNNVRLIDVMPTIMELAGALPLKEAQGKSLTPVLSGKTMDSLLSYSDTRRWEHIDKRTLIDGEMKFITDYKSGKKELYNLSTDPGEQENLIEEMQEKAKSLERRLSEWIAEKEAVAGKPVKRLIEKDKDRLQKLKGLGYLK